MLQSWLLLSYSFVSSFSFILCRILFFQTSAFHLSCLVLAVIVVKKVTSLVSALKLLPVAAATLALSVAKKAT